ncbi:MAG: CPBP family intramembrane glutamic endopeptidase [Planctomycetota bacterium]
MSQPGARDGSCRIGVAVALAAMVFTRIRGAIPAYVDLHRWLATAGLPDEVRNLDGPLLMLAGAIVGAMIASPQPATDLGWRGRALRGVRLGLLFSLPMLLVSAITGGGLRLDTSVLRGALLAPVVEETFFRGLLIAVVVRTTGRSFWPIAVVSSLLFGSIHVPWNASLDLHHLGPFSITAVGGLWYAWLLRQHGWNLWLVVALHAGMNAAWLVFAVGGGAVGSGLWPNIGRGLTIVLGTVWTLRMRRRRVALAVAN